MGWLPVDEGDDCFGWIQEERLERTSHALRVDGRVWLIDPVDGPGIEERIRALGEPAGVLQLLDRHARSSAELAAQLEVPLLRAWQTIADAPFERLPVRDNRLWREVALWEPHSRTLVCADALGTLPFFRAGAERVGVHPLLRLRPPRALASVSPERLLVGHGAGVHDRTAEAVHEAIATARRRLPRAVLAAVTSSRGASR